MLLHGARGDKGRVMSVLNGTRIDADHPQTSMATAAVWDMSCRYGIAALDSLSFWAKSLYCSWYFCSLASEMVKVRQSRDTVCNGVCLIEHQHDITRWLACSWLPFAKDTPFCLQAVGCICLCSLARKITSHMQQRY